MLRKILKRFSDGELAQNLGPEIIDKYESMAGRQLDRSELERAVELLHGFEYVSNPELRKTLVDRMSEEDELDYLLGAMGSPPIKKGYDKYEVLKVLSDKDPNRFIVAMGFSEALVNSANAKLSIDGVKNIQVEYSLYPYQQKIVSKVNALMRSGQNCNRCLLHLPTGAGKTRTAINCASEHLRAHEKGLVLWLADTSELCTQAANEFGRAWRFLGNRDIKLYSYFSDTNISLGGIDNGFLVAGLQKLNAARGSEQYRILFERLAEHVTLIIFDEAHKAIAPTYSEIVNRVIGGKKKPFLLGLSATPGRSLKLSADQDERLSSFFLGNKVTMNVAGYESPIKYLVEQGYLASADFIDIDYEGKKILRDDDFEKNQFSEKVLKELSEDEKRNSKLLEVISEEIEARSSIIVFACSVEHSRSLATLLSFKGIKAHSLDSKHDDDETRRYKISEYINGAVNVLVNFNILTAGFDVPRTNVVIIARPTDSLVQYSQMAGRAMRGRRSGGNERCRIYTVQDDIPAFKSVVGAFTHWDKLWQEV